MAKKRAITLLEIMVVVFFIGIIGSLLAVNMKRTMEKGKVFKTEQAQKQIKDILLLEAAKDDKIDIKKVVQNPQKYLLRSGLVKDAEEYIKDGWGEKFKISAIDHDTDILVFSKNLKNYYDKQNREEKRVSKEETDEEDFE